jgi:hypothetical protein
MLGRLHCKVVCPQHEVSGPSICRCHFDWCASGTAIWTRRTCFASAGNQQLVSVCFGSPRKSCGLIQAGLCLGALVSTLCELVMVGGERTTCASTASSLNLRRANARRPLTHCELDHACCNLCLAGNPDWGWWVGCFALGGNVKQGRAVGSLSIKKTMQAARVCGEPISNIRRVGWCHLHRDAGEVIQAGHWQASPMYIDLGLLVARKAILCDCDVHSGNLKNIGRTRHFARRGP